MAGLPQFSDPSPQRSQGGGLDDFFVSMENRQTLKEKSALKMLEINQRAQDLQLRNSKFNLELLKFQNEQDQMQSDENQEAKDLIDLNSINKMLAEMDKNPEGVTIDEIEKLERMVVPRLGNSKFADGFERQAQRIQEKRLVTETFRVEKNKKDFREVMNDTSKEAFIITDQNQRDPDRDYKLYELGVDPETGQQTVGAERLGFKQSAVNRAGLALSQIKASEDPSKAIAQIGNMEDGKIFQIISENEDLMDRYNDIADTIFSTNTASKVAEQEKQDKIEAEKRAEETAIRKEERADERAIAKEGRKKNVIKATIKDPISGSTIERFITEDELDTVKAEAGFIDANATDLDVVPTNFIEDQPTRQATENRLRESLAEVLLLKWLKKSDLNSLRLLRMKIVDSSILEQV